MTLDDIKPRYPPVDIPDKDLIITCDIDGNVTKSIQIGQVRWSVGGIQRGIIPDPRINFPKIKTMNVYDDDILICAYEKSGTHWLWEIVSMLSKGKDEYEHRKKESLMLEFHYPDEFDNLARPRVLNTHLPFECLPNNVMEKRCKILFIQRNPKDIMVSSYNHKTNMIPPGMSVQSWKAFVHDYLYGEDGLNTFSLYKKGFEDALKDRADHIYSLFYEDLKKDQVAEIQKVAEFLQVSCSKEFAEKVAAKCSFQSLKEADKRIKNAFEIDLNFLYRKGEVGDWKNWFTVAQSEETDARLAEYIKTSPFKFQYS